MIYTLVDFITHIKGIEYVMCLTAIGGFLLLWEALKPKPFKTMLDTSIEDLGYIKRNGGWKHILTTLGKIATAPFVGLAYIVMLPIGFAVVLGASIVNLTLTALSKIVGTNVSFNYRPLEAYFAGKKKKS